MTFEKLTSTVTDFTHIIHVADIHVRLTKRHAEFREVFQRLCEKISDSSETTMVVVAGDVCHSKSDLSPECVQMVSDFLWNISNLRETILIPGNHDATLSNKTRLDSLSPIVDTLAHPKLHYLTQSKLYGIGNVLFNNMCIFDDPDEYIRGIDIPDIYRNTYKHIIALFHGPVDRSVTDTGYAISNPAIMPELFDWHHIALLGDIHRRQNMQEYVPEEHKPCIHYPGSLVQQNHGEPLHPHGYTLWDLDTYDYHYNEIPNDYGYYTVEVNGAKILTDLSDIPKKTYLRIKYTDSIQSEVKTAEAFISTLTEITEVPARIRVESETDKKAKEAQVCKDVKLAEITDVDYQAKLIAEFLQNKLNLTDKSKLDRILLINRIVNTEIKKDDFPRSLKWTPIKFEWDNMFAYGEGNVIDFTKMKGVYGVFGPNTSGKSSIFSAICFCLFDKWERGFKALVAKNATKEGFRCKFEFSIGNLHYFIEKIGETTRSGNVRVQVNFWREVNGIQEDLTNIQRRNTNDTIREYLGTFEDFILTSLSIQNTTKNNINFIDMGNTDRKDLLVQLIGLNVFDRLYENAYAKGKDLAAKLKPHKERNYMKELNDSENILTVTESTIRDTNDSIDDYSRQIKDVNDSIVKETEKLIKLDSEVPTDIAGLESRRTGHKLLLKTKEEQIKTDRVELQTHKEQLDILGEQISEIIVEDLVKAHAEYNSLRKQQEEDLRKFELKKVEINNKLDKLEKLKEYKYNPDCEFCVQNVFVVDARNTEKELVADKVAFSKIEAILDQMRQKLDRCKWVDAAYQHYTKLLNDHSKVKDKFTTVNTKILLAEKDVEKSVQALREVEQKIELYHKNQVSVENNQKVNMTILTFKNALNKVEGFLSQKNKHLLQLTGQREVLKRQIQTLMETMEDMMATEEDRELYDYYCKAVGRNGIPYQVIINTVPEFQREINSILMQISEFTIEIECDEKNITPYVNYVTKGRWPIEMTCGFERFITSVAIRVALTNITNLPRTSFLILDEGFGSLDAHNLPSMFTLFTYLKAHFEFVMVVSHLDSLKDMVDTQIEVSQTGNYSKVVFE